jgi:hypothetical protein
MWQCVCDCGTEKLVERNNLVGGVSKGCIRCRGMSGDKNPMWKGHGIVPHEYWGILNTSAAARRIPVSVTIESLQNRWIKQGGNCSLTGMPLMLATKKMGNTASLDRIDPAKGYVQGNIQWVHKDVNKMKNNLGQSRFIELCKLVAEKNP